MGFHEDIGRDIIGCFNEGARQKGMRVESKACILTVGKNSSTGSHAPSKFYPCPSQGEPLIVVFSLIRGLHS